MDLVGGQSFVFAVVDLFEEWRQLWIIKTRKLRCLNCPPEWAGEDCIKAEDAELDAQGFGPFFAPIGEWEVGGAGMASR